MLKSFCKHLSIQRIEECYRCDLCDKADGRVRFGCGHSVCADCVATGQCPICEPLMEPSSDRPLFESPRTRAKKKLERPPLQDTLVIDEYQRQRISDKLRVEKELFPECIQAPVTYFNKRKSLNVSKSGKENRHTSIFPGEETSSSEEFIMNRSRSYVQEWLNKQPNVSFGPQARSPFSDLKVNTHNYNRATHSTPVKDTQKENVPKIPTRKSNRKRSRLKQTSSTTSQVSLENFLKPVEKGDTKKAWAAKRMKQEFDTKHIKSKVDGKQQKPENDLEIECFTIEDTEDQIVDKDRLALLEVEKANLNEISETMVVIGDTEQFQQKTSHVPFLKKSYLFENCSQCTDNLDTQNSSPDNTPTKSSDVSITVENKSFVATISIVGCYPNKKHSTAVQTDVEKPFLGFEQPAQIETTSLIAKMKEYIETADIAREGEVLETDSQKTSCTDVILVRQENEADGNKVQEDNVQAAISHSGEQGFGVLSPLDGGAGFQNKRTRGGRGLTPDSNNSSDKENCDPNRRKKRDAKKKKKNK